MIFFTQFFPVHSYFLHKNNKLKSIRSYLCGMILNMFDLFFSKFDNQSVTWSHFSLRKFIVVLKFTKNKMILLQGSSRLFVLALIIFGGMAAYVLGEGEEGGGEVTGAGDAVPDGGGVTNAGGEGGGEAGPEGAGDASGGAEGGGDAGGGDAGGGGEGESGGGGEGGGEGAPEGGESGEGDSAKAEGGDGVSKVS